MSGSDGACLAKSLEEGLKASECDLMFESVEKAMRKAGWERVVRCRDCAQSSLTDYAAYLYCGRSSEWMVEPNGFCAWGVRRES